MVTLAELQELLSAVEITVTVTYYLNFDLWHTCYVRTKNATRIWWNKLRQKLLKKHEFSDEETFWSSLQIVYTELLNDIKSNHWT